MWKIWKQNKQNFSKKFEDKSAPNFDIKNPAWNKPIMRIATIVNSIFEARGWKKALLKMLFEFHKPNQKCWSPQIEANHLLQFMCKNKHYARTFLSSFSLNTENYRELFVACFLHTSQAMCKARLEGCLGKQQERTWHHNHCKTPS